MRYATMNGDVVVNVSLWDGTTPWELGHEAIELPEDSPVGPGWMHKDGKWVPPELSAEELAAQQAAEQQNAADAAARDAAIAHAKSLGFTDEMIAVMYPGLTV
mgnify:CR=1 FL=1